MSNIVYVFHDGDELKDFISEHKHLMSLCGFVDMLKLYNSPFYIRYINNRADGYSSLNKIADKEITVDIVKDFIEKFATPFTDQKIIIYKEQASKYAFI